LSEHLPRVRRAAARRERILDTARTLFIDHGFHSTGIAAIAKESDIAVAQLYRDFPSKEDIVAAIVEHDCQELIRSQELKAAIDAQNLVAVRAWLDRLFAQIKDDGHDRMFIEIIAESSRNPRISSVFKSLELTLREHILEALNVLAPGDTLTAQRGNLAHLIMVLSVGLLHHRLMHNIEHRDQVHNDTLCIVDAQIEMLKAGQQER